MSFCSSDRKSKATADSSPHQAGATVCIFVHQRAHLLTRQAPSLPMTCMTSFRLSNRSLRRCSSLICSLTAPCCCSVLMASSKEWRLCVHTSSLRRVPAQQVGSCLRQTGDGQTSALPVQWLGHASACREQQAASRQTLVEWLLWDPHSPLVQSVCTRSKCQHSGHTSSLCRVPAVVAGAETASKPCTLHR